MATQLNNSAWLEWIASLVGGEPRRTLTAAWPAEQFYCLLDEPPLHLIPQRQLVDSSRLRKLRAQAPLVVNPECSILPAGQVPEELESQRHLLENFNLSRTTAWVRDPASGALYPFLLGPKLEGAIAGLRPGESAPDSLADQAALLFFNAGILTTSDALQCGNARRAETLCSANARFREKNYFPVAALIHPFQIAALRRYYRNKIRRGAIRLGDEQSSRRYVAHNESVARFFHRQIAKVVSAIAGEPVKPSYVYLASYLSGAELKKHMDREQCEFSVTLCLDFSPEPELATPWPIKLDTPQGTVTVYQALGDGLVYRGTKVPHYRDALGDGRTSTSIFFHYVAADFSGPLD